jgi:hypothetical protein
LTGNRIQDIVSAKGVALHDAGAMKVKSFYDTFRIRSFSDCKDGEPVRSGYDKS